ncbi:MAG: S1C family serine protease [Betaproteobacteria bacterium]
MAEPESWAFPSELQPNAGELHFDLTAVLDAVVKLRAEIPEDAFTASILGTERFGNGVVIREDGLTLTIGYLITEAESIWITTNRGTVVQGHPLAYDFATGFGLILPLGRLGVAPIARGTITTANVGDDVFVVGHGGRAHALKARLNDKREFAGYWEYLLDEALFTVPAHPHWSGAPLVGADGRVLGIGSLLVQEEVQGNATQGNMFVPIDLLAPILEDLVTTGRSSLPPRPWLGMYTQETEGHMLVAGLAEGGPAQAAGVRSGDLVLEIAAERVASLTELLRKIWRLGPAGTEVPLTLGRDGALVHIRVRSADRGDYLKKPRLH